MSLPLFRRPTLNDVDRCFEIEITAYEGDEAATREKIATRIADYPQGFLLLEVDGQAVGFINSGCAWEVVMSDEAFKELVGHDAVAPNVVIMSVVVDPQWQGKGYAAQLMHTFIDEQRALGKQSIHLMCKTQHIELYRKFGFAYIKPSESDHGGMAWHEMIKTL